MANSVNEASGIAETVQTDDSNVGISQEDFNTLLYKALGQDKIKYQLAQTLGYDSDEGLVSSLNGTLTKSIKLAITEQSTSDVKSIKDYIDKKIKDVTDDVSDVNDYASDNKDALTELASSLKAIKEVDDKINTQNDGIRSTLDLINQTVATCAKEKTVSDLLKDVTDLPDQLKETTKALTEKCKSISDDLLSFQASITECGNNIDDWINTKKTSAGFSSSTVDALETMVTLSSQFNTLSDTYYKVKTQLEEFNEKVTEVIPSVANFAASLQKKTDSQDGMYDAIKASSYVGMPKTMLDTVNGITNLVNAFKNKQDL